MLFAFSAASKIKGSPLLVYVTVCFLPSLIFVWSAVALLVFMMLTMHYGGFSNSTYHHMDNHLADNSIL